MTVFKCGLALNCITWLGRINCSTRGMSWAHQRPHKNAFKFDSTCTALSSMARDMAASLNGIQPRCQA
jgi:hypothetical protein